MEGKERGFNDFNISSMTMGAEKCVWVGVCVCVCVCVCLCVCV